MAALYKELYLKACHDCDRTGKRSWAVQCSGGYVMAFKAPFSLNLKQEAGQYYELNFVACILTVAYLQKSCTFHVLSNGKKVFKKLLVLPISSRSS